MPVHLDLFLTFAKIGVLSFGGGYSMLPMFKRELSDKHGWITDAEIADFFSVSQCIPGLIACNTAILAGYRKKGVTGGIVSALGIITPSIIIILVIAAFISSFSEYELVRNAFAGIRVCVTVLILNTVLKLWKSAIVDKASLCIFTLVFLVSSFTKITAALLVVIAGFLGIAITAVRKERRH